jgi:hypothetical protein
MGSMVKRFLYGGLALASLYLGAGYLLRFFASDEQKIRWLVERMEEAYNHGSPGGCVGPLAKDWRHEGHEVDRELLLAGLFQAARDRDRETRALRSRVSVHPETTAIEVQGEHATLATEATFERLRGGKWESAWRVRFEAELQDAEGGWEIVRSRHEDLLGTQLGR